MADTRAEPELRMPFLQHLEELRIRLRRAAIAYLFGVILAYAVSRWLFAALAWPLVIAWREAGFAAAPALNFKSPTEPLFVFIRVALLGGLFLSSPYMFLQLWKFVAPGLYRRERSFVFKLVLGSAVCFLAGAAFGYFVAFPALFKFLLEFARENAGGIQEILGGMIQVETIELRPVIMMEEYLGLVAKTLIGFGACFELPVLMVFLGMAGLVTHRTFLRWGRYAIVVIVIVAGIVTPDPSMATQVMLSVPLIALYYLGVLLVFVVGRRKAEASGVPEAEGKEAAR
jgi:sec-independent protein translocase protein TatC